MSDSRRTSPQYRIIQQLTLELTDAVKDDLCDLSNHLLKHGLITENNHEDFTKHSVSSYVRASNLIRTILNRIKVDVRHYSTFVKVLEENERYYKSVLRKIYSHNDGVVTFGQPSLPELAPSNMEQSDNEASPFLRAPYVQYESDGDCSNRQDTINLPTLIRSADSADEDFDKPLGGVQHQQLSDAQRAREQYLDAIFGNFCLPCIIGIEVLLIIIHFITSAAACINILFYMFTLIVIAALVAFVLVWNLIHVYFLLLYGSRLCTRRTVLCNIVPWIVVISIWCFTYVYLCT